MKRILLILALSMCVTSPVCSQASAVIDAKSTKPALSRRFESLENNTLTPSEQQELNLARQKALQADPDLIKESEQLSQKVRDFQQKLDRAILRANPSVAEVVTIMEMRQ